VTDGTTWHDMTQTRPMRHLVVLADFVPLEWHDFALHIAGQCGNKIRASVRLAYIIYVHCCWRVGKKHRALCIRRTRTADADACNVARVSCNVAGVSCKVGRVSFNVARVSCNVAGVSCNVAGVSCNVARVSCNVARVSLTLQETPATLHETRATSHEIPKH